MHMWASIMAVGDGGGELFYVIAILILGAITAIVEKVKQKMAGDDAPKREPPATRRAKPGPQPPRPARPQPPAARPADRRTPPVRPAAPAAPARPPTPARRAAPPRPPTTRAPAPPAPTPQIEETHRRLVAEAPTLQDVGEHEIGHVAQHHMETKVEKGRKPGKLTRKADRRPAAAPQAHTRSSVGSFRNLTLPEVRRAIVLSEILSPPLALRDPDQLWDRY